MKDIIYIYKVVFKNGHVNRLSFLQRDDEFNKRIVQDMYPNSLESFEFHHEEEYSDEQE